MRAGVGLDLRASRRGHEDMAILPAAELRSLEETAHLMRSPANARRLLAALHRALADEGDAESPAALRADVGLRRWPRKSGRRGFPSSRVFQAEFREDLRHWVEVDRRTALRVLDLVGAVLRDAFSGIGKPEPLKHLGCGVWSRCHS
jgi:Txe/YoeB family toxin of Txe-Axe toxin-antitoxin module